MGYDAADVRRQMGCRIEEMDKRIAELEKALRDLLDANTLEGTANNLTEEKWAAVVTQAVAALEPK